MIKILPVRKTTPPMQLCDHLKAEFDLGISMSADPLNANKRDLVSRISTIYSPWFGRTCRDCRDKFREGDIVRLCPKCGEAYHDDARYHLACWQKHFQNGRVCKSSPDQRFTSTASASMACDYLFDGLLPEENENELHSADHLNFDSFPAPQMLHQFLDGLETIWKPFGEQKNIQVLKDSDLIGLSCPWCRFRIRLGDWIVACPCGNNCRTYFHQDVFRHLTCWNEWNGVAGNQFCPTTGSPFKITGEKA